MSNIQPNKNCPPSARENERLRLLNFTQFSILLALEAVVCFTPLGSLPIGVIVATLGHIPVVVTAILLGTKSGTAMGFTCGLFSFLVWTFRPPNPAIAFLFTPFYSAGALQGSAWSLVICFIPRILLGTSAALLFRWFQKHHWHPIAQYALPAVLASMLHTFLVMGGMYAFFGRQLLGESYTLNAAVAAIGSVVLSNGLLEWFLAGMVAYVACRPLHKYLLK